MWVKRLSKTRSRALWSLLTAQYLPNNIPSLANTIIDAFAIYRTFIRFYDVHKLSCNMLFIFDFILLVSISYLPLSPCQAEIAKFLVTRTSNNWIPLCVNLGKIWEQMLMFYKLFRFQINSCNSKETATQRWHWSEIAPNSFTFFPVKFREGIGETSVRIFRVQPLGLNVWDTFGGERSASAEINRRLLKKANHEAFEYYRGAAQCRQYSIGDWQ